MVVVDAAVRVVLLPVPTKSAAILQVVSLKPKILGFDEVEFIRGNVDSGRQRAHELAMIVFLRRPVRQRVNRVSVVRDDGVPLEPKQVAQDEAKVPAAHRWG